MRLRALSVSFALAALCSAYYSTAGFDHTHQRLTQVIFGAGVTPNVTHLILPDGSYADLYKFYRQILVEDGDQEDAHYKPASSGVDTTVQYWYKNESQWDIQLRQNHYPLGMFVQAYTDLGYIVHLAQDSTVPAHDRVIFHGLPSDYWLRPGGLYLSHTPYSLPRTDDYEGEAADAATVQLARYDDSLDSFLATTVNRVFPFRGFMCSADRKFWLCPQEGQAKVSNYSLCAATPATWGVHSLPLGAGCDYPDLGNDMDWYADSRTDAEAARDIVRRGMYLAIRLAREQLARYSESLPPVVIGPQARLNADFAGSGTIAFEFRIQENRLDGVYLQVLDPSTGKFIRASVGGYAGLVWSGNKSNPLWLDRQPDSDLTVLPWSKSFTAVWDGKFGDGTMIGSGSQKLRIVAEDQDGNLSNVAEVLLDVTLPQPGGPAVTAILDAAGFQPRISSGAWVAIFGGNLAATTRLWREDEIVGGRLPTRLDGVSATINGRPAAICYISPTQLNVQVPADTTTGPVQVQVTAPQGTATATAQMQQFSPGLFTFDGKYVTALHVDNSYIGKPNLLSGATTTPAKPGEVAIFWGAGFGPTNPVTPTGQLVTSPAPLANTVTVWIGNMRADVDWAGLSGAGLWQLNVKIPETLPDGDALVVAEVGGVQTQPGAYLTIQR